MAANAIAAGISIETRAAGPLDADIDPVRVREVLTNLVGNALRYARAVVGVDAASAGDRLSVTVSDDGPGIASDVLPHMFERFSKSGESRGAGLGLAIAKSLVVAHGGDIAAETGADQGTRIRFTLPRDG